MTRHREYVSGILEIDGNRFLARHVKASKFMKRACKIGLSSCHCRSCKPVTQCYTVNKLLELKYLWLVQFDVTLIVSWVLPWKTMIRHLRLHTLICPDLLHAKTTWPRNIRHPRVSSQRIAHPNWPQSGCGAWPPHKNTNFCLFRIDLYQEYSCKDK